MKQRILWTVTAMAMIFAVNLTALAITTPLPPLTDELNPQRQEIGEGTRNLVLCIHGWNNPPVNNRYSDTTEWAWLVSKIKPVMQANTSDPWALVLYDWHQDAATGFIDFYGDSAGLALPHATQASINARDHGLTLGPRLPSSLRRVHIITHSAGVWCAREVAADLLARNPYVVIQVTFLDPFIPEAVAPSGGLFSKSRIQELASLPGSNRIWLLENYYADDFPAGIATAWTLGTQEVFSWGSIGMNLQVEWDSDLFHPPGINAYYDWHSGPTLFYGDTIAAADLGSVSSRLPPSSPPYVYQGYGWYNSLFHRTEPQWASLPRITTQPQNKSVVSGASVTLSVQGSSILPLSYQWFKRGQASPISGATGASYTFTASFAGAGDYVVRVSDSAGMIFSDFATVTVTDAPPPATAPAVISVSPSTLPPSFSTQLINIYGSNFKASGDPNASTLIFRDPANIAYVRTPIFVSSSQLQYNITVQLAVGTWSVTVTNAGQAASNLKTFLVETPTPNTGSITVNITPAGAVSAGAQWRVDNGSYLNDGAVATSVLPGSHTVSFKTVSGYNTPASLTLNIVANQQATVNAIYSAIANCNYSLSSSGDTWAAAGGSDAFSVLTSAGCAWNATENLSWVSITSGSSGVGSHSVGYQVDYNPSTSPRSGVITAGGQYFNINQNGNQLACTFSFSSPGANFESGGGSGSFSISTAAICDWEANTNANWVSITGGKSGTGSGSIQYAVQSNPGSSSRTATITAGGQTFTIVQAGAPLPPGTIASGLSNPTEIALDQDFVYWIEYRAKIVKRASKLGGQELLLASSSFNPKGIAVDDSFVYYFDGGSQLFKVPKAGGSPVLLASSVSPERITLDATRVYWTEFSGNVKSIAKTGGAVTTEATGTYAAAGIRVDNDAIYWSCFNNPGPLYKKLKSGGDKTALYSSGDTTVGVALDTNLVFWTTSDAIWRISPDGSGRSAVKSGLRYVWDLAFDGTNLFWTENTTSPRGTINQVLKQGGSFINLATNLAEPVSIAVDSQKVFWLERNGGTTGSGSLKWIAKGVVQADTIAPQVVITNPPDAARFNDPALNVSGIASDDTGVVTVEVRLNGGSWQPASGTTNWTRSVSLVVSNNTIEARSRDNAGNYSPLGTVTVTYIPPDAKLPQAITFGALSKQVFGDAPFALSATASSGLPVSFSVLSGPAVLSGNILTMTGAGLVVLRASQSGDATYNAAPNVDQVLLIVPGNNVITDAQRLANGMFTMRFYGDTGTNYVVKASTNLVNWLPVATNQISGLGYLEFTDVSSTNFDRRFYLIAP